MNRFKKIKNNLAKFAVAGSLLAFSPMVSAQPTQNASVESYYSSISSTFNRIRRALIEGSDVLHDEVDYLKAQLDDLDNPNISVQECDLSVLLENMLEWFRQEGNRFPDSADVSSVVEKIVGALNILNQNSCDPEVTVPSGRIDEGSSAPHEELRNPLPQTQQGLEIPAEQVGTSADDVNDVVILDVETVSRLDDPEVFRIALSGVVSSIEQNDLESAKDSANRLLENIENAARSGRFRTDNSERMFLMDAQDRLNNAQSPEEVKQILNEVFDRFNISSPALREDTSQITIETVGRSQRTLSLVLGWTETLNNCGIDEYLLFGQRQGSLCLHNVSVWADISLLRISLLRKLRLSRGETILFRDGSVIAPSSSSIEISRENGGGWSTSLGVSAAIILPFDHPWILTPYAEIANYARYNLREYSTYAMGTVNEGLWGVHLHSLMTNDSAVGLRADVSFVGNPTRNILTSLELPIQLALLFEISPGIGYLKLGDRHLMQAYLMNVLNLGRLSFEVGGGLETDMDSLTRLWARGAISVLVGDVLIKPELVYQQPDIEPSGWSVLLTVWVNR